MEISLTDVTSAPYEDQLGHVQQIYNESSEWRTHRDVRWQSLLS